MIKVFSHTGIRPYTGFVYIWRDSSNGKFYIGSHSGPIDDKYKGSGWYFKNAYKLRPECFKRRILEYVCGTREDLAERENFWLSKITDDKLEFCYYNQTRSVRGIKDFSLELRQKISKSKLGKQLTTEHKAKISKALEGNDWNLGRQLTEEHKAKISANVTGKAKTLDLEVIRKQRIKDTMIGQKYSKDRCLNIGLSKKGLLWYTDGYTTKQFRENEQPSGWIRGRKLKGI